MGLLNNDIVRVDWRGSIFAQRIILTSTWVLFGDYNAGTTVAEDLDDILNNLRAGGAFDKTTTLLACMPPSYSLTEIRAQRVRTLRSAFRSNVNGLPAAGTNANDTERSTIAAAATFRTDFSGRDQVCTKHIGPVPDLGVVDGVLTAAYQLTVANWATTFRLGFTPAGSGTLVAPVIFHKATNTWDIITGLFIQGSARTMRRRVVGRGE